MNAHHSPGAAKHDLVPHAKEAARAPIRLHPCSECNGTGGFYETVRIVGEGFDADQREVDCDACNGTGEVEATCDCGEALDVTGYCAACEYPSGWALAELSHRVSL